MSGWALRLPLGAADRAAPLRSHAGVECFATLSILWLRGDGPSEELERLLRSVLGAERFTWLADGQLAPAGRAIPTARLPDGNWSPLNKWMELATPPASLPGVLPTKASLRLVRSTRESPANLLFTPFAPWRDYAITAAEIRLRHLSFAVSDDGQALIRGAPLPPLPGVPLVEQCGVAIPAGWHWSPAIDASVLRQLLELEQDDLAVFTLEGTCDIVRGDSFVRATRSAIRLTQKELTA